MSACAGALAAANAKHAIIKRPFITISSSALAPL
jgi:hypothetical protein